MLEGLDGVQPDDDFVFFLYIEKVKRREIKGGMSCLLPTDWVVSSSGGLASPGVDGCDSSRSGMDGG